MKNQFVIFFLTGLMTCIQVNAQSDQLYQGKIGKTLDESTEWWPEPVKAPEGAPNIIWILIDDVGFGRSSLETLILLEPDLVKVDRKYVSGLSNEPAKARLLRRLTNVAKSLGAEIVAEGIEDRRDLPLLKDMGVNYGQGFLWGELLQILPDGEEVHHNHEGVA